MVAKQIALQSNGNRMIQKYSNPWKLWVEKIYYCFSTHWLFFLLETVRWVSCT